jgi:hypothetical protein
MFSQDEILRWVGIGFGLVGFIRALYFFINEQVVGGLLTLGIVVVLVAAIFIIRWLISLPPFTVLENKKTLSFEGDPRGHNARHHDVRKIRANHKGMSEYWFKEIGPPNFIQDIQVDGDPPSDQQTELNALRICKRFPQALGWREKFKTTLSLDIAGAFPESHEAYIHKGMDATKKLEIKVKFHNQKRCISGKAYVGYGGGAYEPLTTGNFSRSEDGRELELIIKKPRRGQHYRIEWDW